MNCPCEQSPQPKYTQATGVNVKELPIDQFEQAPDYFMTIRTKIKTDGTVKYQPMLTPGNAVVAQTLNANETLLPANNPSLSVPVDQVLPAYVENTGSKTVIYPADANHPAQFLVTEVKDNGMAVCQNSGWLNMPASHKYVIGSNYYRSSESGEVTTDPSQTGQYLFTPVGRFTLAVDIKRGV